jgi:group I intron endonuclease
MIIYKIINKVNGKFYIGKTTKGMDERMKEHLNSKFENTHSLIHKAIEKYGKENFYIEELCSCSSYDELNEKEQFYIKELQAIKLGYNLGSGGDGGDNLSNHPDNKLIREKIGESSKIHWTDERKKKHSQRMSGDSNPNYGNTYGFKKGHVPINAGKTLEETYGRNKASNIKEKVAKQNVGTKKPGTAKAMRENNPSWRKDVKEKLSKANKNKVMSSEARKKMSEAHTGKVLTEKHRLNIGKANSGKNNGRYIHIDKDTTNKIISLYNDGFNLTDISRKVGLTTRKISKFLKEKGIEIKKSRPSKNVEV